MIKFHIKGIEPVNIDIKINESEIFDFIIPRPRKIIINRESSKKA